MEGVTEYSDPHKNHDRLLKNVKLLRNPKFKPDWLWYHKQYKHCIAYRKQFPCIENCNQYIEDEEYRMNLKVCDALLDTLIHSYRMTNRFSCSHYLKLNQLLIKIVNEAKEYDELCTAFECL